jgi:D-alanyl-D-alanine dipeptidase
MRCSSLLIFFLLFSFAGCGPPNGQKLKFASTHRPSSLEVDPFLRKNQSRWEQNMKLAGLVDVQEIDPTLKVNLKYSSIDNFLKLDVYGDMERAYLQPDVAERLVNAQKELKKLHPDFALIVLDAARPLALQQVFWDSIKVPKSERTKYVANPGNGGSLHNYGAAVDVSIMDSTGAELDMGCAFDFFGELAYPVSEWKFLASGELSQDQVAHRKLLRQVMSQAGFFNIQTEWWHFNACNRDHARQVYQLLE